MRVTHCYCDGCGTEIERGAFYGRVRMEDCRFDRSAPFWERYYEVCSPACVLTATEKLMREMLAEATVMHVQAVS